jgi:ABC-type antimicrobial peptide transport system permease subunit
VGQQLSAKVSGQRKELEVIGVVKNAGLNGMRKEAPPAVYVAYYQLGSRDGAMAANFPSAVVVRASGSLSQVADAVRSKLQPQMPDTPLEVRPLSTQVEAAMVQERLLALLAAIFGGLALVLAFIGLYGLLGYSVARRTRELGIRMALGAQRSGVVSMVLRRALGLVLVGVVVGLPAALVASRWVKSMLFGLNPDDPATLAGAAIVLVGAGIGAAYFPARRAAGIDPVAALREE